MGKSLLSMRYLRRVIYEERGMAGCIAISK